MPMWNYLDLRHPDMRPPLGQAVVVRTGSLSFAKDATYRVGHFATDPREPGSCGFTGAAAASRIPPAGRNTTPISASCRWIRRREV